MSIRSLVATAAVGLAAGLALPAAANAYTSYTTGSVNQRVAPGVGSPKIGTLPPGASVDVRFCQPGWCAVYSYLGGGWVSARYLAGAAQPYPRFVPQPFPQLFPQPYPRLYRQPAPLFQLYIGPRRPWW